MRTLRIAARVAALVLFANAGFVVGVSSPTLAAAKDYRFELVGSPVKAAKATLIKVRLTHIPDSKPVSGAIIIQSKLDMAPGAGMPGMTAPAKASPSTEPGVYQIEAAPEMDGNWALALSAKVQGEAETVTGTVTVPIK